MRDEGPARFGDDVGMGHVLGRARLGDLRDDVAGILGEGVVDRAVEVGLAAVVVDPEAAAAVDHAHVGAHEVQFDEDAGGLAHGVADRADGGDLRADVEVEELQAVEHSLLPELLDRVHHLAGGEAELRAIAGGFDPFARALGGEARAHADDRPHIELAGAADDGVDFLGPVDGDDHLTPELLGEERGLDESLVLVSVAQDVGVGVLLEGEGDQELGLAPCLDAETVGRPVLDQFLDHVTLLVHLDRVDPAEASLVIVLGDGGVEGAEELLDAELQDVGEADEDGQVAAPALQILDQFLEIDGAFAGSLGRHLDVARFVDGEEVLAPPVHVIELGCIFDRPSPKVCLLSQLFMNSYATPCRESASLLLSKVRRADCKRCETVPS